MGLPMIWTAPGAFSKVAGSSAESNELDSKGVMVVKEGRE
jgi:hypothetical protein